VFLGLLSFREEGARGFVITMFTVRVHSFQFWKYLTGTLVNFGIYVDKREVFLSLLSFREERELGFVITRFSAYEYPFQILKYFPERLVNFGIYVRAKGSLPWPTFLP
jgi:hypothetical protein